MAMKSRCGRAGERVEAAFANGEGGDQSQQQGAANAG